MKLERYFKTQVEEQTTRNRISFYLESKGYRQREAQPDLVYESPAGTSTLIHSQTSHYDAVITVRTLKSTDGMLVVAVSYDLATTTSMIGKQESEYWEGEFAKLVTAVNGPMTQTVAPVKQRKQPDLMSRHLNGANWFFWIAGLSVVNSVIVLVGGSWYFLVGLGVTQFVDGFMLAMIEAGGAETEFLFKAIGFVVDILIAGLFVLFGFLARKHKGGYIAGMIVYAVDALIFLIVPDFLSIGFHIFALFGIFAGFTAFQKLEQQQQAQPAVFQQL